jgi:hypothetical protein
MSESRDPEPQQPPERSRFGEWAYRIFGPAQVDGAIQGHSPEARESWKRRVAARRQEREDSARKRHERG